MYMSTPAYTPYTPYTPWHAVHREQQLAAHKEEEVEAASEDVEADTDGQKAHADDIQEANPIYDELWEGCNCVRLTRPETEEQ